MSGFDSVRVGRDVWGKILIVGVVLNYLLCYMCFYYLNYVWI